MPKSSTARAVDDDLVAASPPQASKALPTQQPTVFTDLSRAWELDRTNPFRYNASIFYMKPAPLYDVEKPYFMNVPVDPSWIPTLRQTNVSYTRKTVAVSDIRRHENIFSLTNTDLSSERS